MAEEKVDISVVHTLLNSLKGSIDEAIASASKGGGSLASSLARRALEDQNTGCQNSGCGGGAAADIAANSAPSKIR